MNVQLIIGLYHHYNACQDAYVNKRILHVICSMNRSPELSERSVIIFTPVKQLLQLFIRDKGVKVIAGQNNCSILFQREGNQYV